MSWKNLYVGNVVRWSGRLWIVARKVKDSLELIMFDGSNVTVNPSTTWPEDLERRVDSVERVAENPKDMLLQIIRSLLRTMEEKV